MGISTFCDTLTGGALNHVNCQHYVMGKLNVQGFSLRGGGWALLDLIGT